VDVDPIRHSEHSKVSKTVPPGVHACLILTTLMYVVSAVGNGAVLALNTAVVAEDLFQLK